MFHFLQNGQIFHHGTGLCLEATHKNNIYGLLIAECNPNNSKQKWKMHREQSHSTPAWARIANEIDKFKEN